VTVNAVKHLIVTALLLKPATRRFIFAWLAWRRSRQSRSLSNTDATVALV
jgi:hypothetical protein